MEVAARWIRDEVINKIAKTCDWEIFREPMRSSSMLLTLIDEASNESLHVKQVQAHMLLQALW
jgi:hypothetical protein